MKIRHNSLTVNDFTFLIKIILFLSVASISLADEKKIGSMKELLPILEKAVQTAKPLIIIAEDIINRFCHCPY